MGYGGVCEREIGVAGLKDKWAITKQWLSIPNRKAGAVRLLADVPGVEVLSASRKKLAIGHLRGNEFKIKIRDISSSDRFSGRSVLEAINSRGSPNYFVPQRCRRYGRNAIAVSGWLGEKTYLVDRS